MSNRYSPANAVEAYLMVPPQFQEQIYAGLVNRAGTNLRCVVISTPRENAKQNNFSDGTSEYLSFGEDRWDMTVSFTKNDRVSEMLVERIRKLNVPVYIYPRAAGTMQFGLPLIRGLGTDPVETPTVTNARAVATGTTMYLPRSVSGMGEKLYAAEDPCLMPGFPSGSNYLLPFVLGSGLGVFRPRVNLIKYSSLNAVTQSGVCPIDGWCAAGSGGTAGTDRDLNDSPWLPGEKTWWTTNSLSQLHSYKFPLTSLTGDPYFSCFAMVDGEGVVRIVDTSSSTVLASRSIPAGSGRFETNFTGITPGSYASCRLEIQLASGAYLEIGHMTLINPGSDVLATYLPYLSTDSAAYGELTADGLLVEDMVFRNNYQRPTSTGASRDNALSFSCFYQPCFGVGTQIARRTIMFADHYTTSSLGDIEAAFQYYSGNHEFALYAGGIRVAGATVSDFREGDVFAVVLGSGNDGSSAKSQLNAVNMRTGDTYTTTALTTTLQRAHRVFLGRRSTSDLQCDGIIGGFTVDSVPFSKLTAYAQRLGNDDLMDLSRRTAGRWYHLKQNTTYRKFTRQAYEGSLYLEEARAI